MSAAKWLEGTISVAKTDNNKSERTEAATTRMNKKDGSGAIDVFRRHPLFHIIILIIVVAIHSPRLASPLKKSNGDASSA